MTNPKPRIFYTRKLDALIAKLVFGWKHFQFNRAYGEPYTQFCSPDSFPALRRLYPDIMEEVTSGGESSTPLYSTSPNDSKLLRNRVREMGWKYHLGWNGIEVTATVQRGSPTPGGNWGHGESTASTEELAFACAVLQLLTNRD